MVEARLGALVVGEVGEGVRGLEGALGRLSVFLGGEFQSMCLEFLPRAGKIIGSGFERSDG